MNPVALETNVGGPPKRVKYVWLSISLEGQYLDQKACM